MTLQANKDLALTFISALAEGDLDRMDELMADDATWWVIPSTGFSGLHQKSELMATVPKLFEMAERPVKLRFIDITAEEDRVNVTAEGWLTLKDGSTHENHYSFLIFARDGKVSSGKEYVDTAQVAKMFGSGHATKD